MNHLFEVSAYGDEPYEDLPRAFAQFQATASAAGADFKDMARDWIEQLGGTVEATKLAFDSYPAGGLIRGRNGSRFVLLAHGTPDDGPRAGLRRTDTVLKMGCRAVMIARRTDLPILVVTSHLPDLNCRAGRILTDLQADIFDVAAIVGDLAGYRRFARHLTETPPAGQPPASMWRAAAFRQPNLFSGDGPGDA